MLRNWATGEACPRCGLFHDPASHDTHEHSFPLETVRTCRAIVSIRQNCACGQKAPNMRFSLGQRAHWIDFRLRAVGLLGPSEAGM